MTLKEFGEAVEFNIANNLKTAILGLGAPGLGKSQIIRQIGEKYGYKVIDVRLAQMSEVEIGGLIYPNESRTGTIWLTPEILPNEARDGEKTILVLDEITSCSKRVQVAAYQLILDRKIGQYKLPEGCFVIALGNREDDNGVYIQLAGPLADRFEIHYIEPDFDSWKYEYALPKGVHHFVVEYLTFKPSALHTQALEEDDTFVFATPRSWERVSDILKICEDTQQTVIQNKIVGNVGEREGRQFIEFCNRHGDMVSADDYIEGRKEAPESPEELSILVESLVRKCDFLGSKKQVLELTNDERMLVEKIIKALFRLPMAEFTVVGVKGLLRINREIVKTIACELNDASVERFIEKNRTALGLEIPRERNPWDRKTSETENNRSWMSLWN